MKKYFKSFLINEEGSEFLQFVLIIAGIALAAVGILALFGKIGGQVDKAVDLVDSLDGNSATTPTI